MSESDGNGGWRSAPGWMKLLLIVSLALNLAVAGLVGGHAIRGSDDRAFAKVEPEPDLDRRQTRLLHMVPEAERDQARQMLLARQDEIDRARRQMQEAHMALIEAIRQDPLNPERLEQALARRHEASGTFWQIGSEQLVAIARKLDGGARDKLAERLEERTRRWMARHERKEK